MTISTTAVCSSGLEHKLRAMARRDPLHATLFWFTWVSFGVAAFIAVAMLAMDILIGRSIGWERSFFMVFNAGTILMMGGLVSMDWRETMLDMDDKTARDVAAFAWSPQTAKLLRELRAGKVHTIDRATLRKVASAELIERRAIAGGRA